MELARVVGTVVSTKKNERLNGYKFLLVETTEPDGKPKGKFFVAVDLVDAGVGDLVLLVRGSSARTAEGLTDKPVDGSIVGVVDAVTMGGRIVYFKGKND